MKVAFIGKGGSGKSTVSWLMTRLLSAEGRTVLAIDADHNMDLAALLGQKIGADTPTMHRAADECKRLIGQKDGENWRDVLDGRTLPRFTFLPSDPYTALLARPAGEGVHLMTVGLGADDVLFSDRCAHGHSASLKFYLPLLDEGAGADVVVDGVAGADMMNFGLFLGTDAVAVVVEPHENSMRVLEQVASIAERSGLPLFVVINKAAHDAALVADIEERWGERVIGRIPLDTALLSYDFEHLSPETRSAGRQILRALRDKIPRADTLARLRAFEAEKASVER